MFTVSIVKIKLFTILSMVFMGLFSRLVLGFPMIFQSSSPTLMGTHPSHQFPDSGARTSIRFMPASRFVQKRRRNHKNGNSIEDDFTFQETEGEQPDLDFIGDVIEPVDKIHTNKVSQ